MKRGSLFLVSLLFACGGTNEPLTPNRLAPQLRFWSGPGELRPVTVAANSQGQLLVVGTYSESVRYRGVLLQARSPFDLFIFALESSGAVRWARSVDQSQFRFEGIRATARSAGGWWLAGHSIDGPAKLDEFELPQSDLPQALILQFDETGVVQRGRSIDASQGSRITAVTATPNSVVIAGRFSGDFSWGGAQLNSPDSDVFAAVLDEQLQFTVQRQQQGAGFDVVNSAAVDGDEVLLAGRFQDRLGSLRAEGGGDGFVWQLQKDRLEVFGGPGDDDAMTLLAPDARPQSLPWLAGRLSAPLNVDPQGTAGMTRDDLFVGRGQRFIRLSGPGLERAAGLVDLDDGALLLGTHQDGGGVGRLRLEPAGGDAVFVLEVDEQGRLRRLVSWFEGSDDHRAAAVATDPEQWHVLGGFDGTLRLGSETWRASGNRDVFLVSVPR